MARFIAPHLRPKRALPSISKRPVNLCSHNEIALGEAVDLVRPHRDLGFAPGQQNIRMMPLLFGERSHSIHEIKCLFEVRELEQASDVMLIDHAPLRD